MMTKENGFRKKAVSVFLRWHDPDQVPGCDLSPGPPSADRWDTPNGTTLC